MHFSKSSAFSDLCRRTHAEKTLAMDALRSQHSSQKVTLSLSLCERSQSKCGVTGSPWF